MQSLSKHKTGICGLDEVLGGGLPEGRGLIIIGGPGTGKTNLLSEFLYRGITEHHQNGVFVTFEEKPQYIMENMRSFGWDLQALIGKGKLMFVDASPELNYEEISETYDLEPLIERIKYAVSEVKARRVVIDGIANLFQKFNNKRIIRQVIFQISNELKKMGITYMISSEKPGDYSGNCVEEYVSDGVVELTRENTQRFVARSLEVIKVRGSSYISGKITFEITDSGITLYPQIQLEGGEYKKRSKEKYKFGIEKFDKAIGGGLPMGSTTVIVGSTGTGKSILASHFLHEGIENGQNGIYISFKDSVYSIARSFNNKGWTFDKKKKKQQLKVITKIEHPDKLIYTIIDAIQEINARRVVIDSIAFIDPTVAYPNKVTDFYITLIRWMKINGVTCLLNYLSTEDDVAEVGALFSALETPVRRVLNAMPDGTIALSYVIEGGVIKKKLTILKLRNEYHSTEIMNYKLDHGDFCLEDPKKVDNSRGKE